MEDDKIVELYWARSEDALAETSSKYGRYCYTIAYNILANVEDADESVNDTYMGAWNSMPPQRPTVLSTYLGKLTRRISINRWYSNTAEKRGGGEVAMSIDELSECLPVSTTVEDEVESQLLSSVISNYLRSLPDHKRRVFVCRYWYSYSIDEISALFGYSKTKIVNMLSRLRHGLKIWLEKELLA